MPEILEEQIKSLEKEIFKKFALVGEMSFKYGSGLSEEFLDKQCASIKSMKEELRILKKRAKQKAAV